MDKTGKQKTAGFTLVEVIVAIAIMGLVSVPICGSLVLAGRINAQSSAVMEAQLDVRSAVETLMESGVTGESDTYRNTDFPDVSIKTKRHKDSDDADLPYYLVTVSDDRGLVTVETYIRAVPEGGGTE